MNDRIYEIDTDERFFDVIQSERKACIGLTLRARNEGFTHIFFAKKLSHQSYQQLPEFYGQLDKGIRTHDFIISTDEKVFESIRVGDIYSLLLRYS